MTLSEVEKQRIEKIIGEYCRGRVPKHLQDQIKLIYKLKGNEVQIIETRQHWKKKDQWIEIPIARLTLESKSMKWKIYWQRANGVWILYENLDATDDLKQVIEEIEKDPLHVFWG